MNLLDDESGLQGNLLETEQKAPAVYGPQTKEDAAYTSMLAGRSDLDSHSNLLKSEIERDGESPEVNQAKVNANIKDQQRQRDKLDQLIADPSASPDDITAAIEQYDQNVKLGVDLATDTSHDLLASERNKEIAAMKAENLQSLLGEERTYAKLQSWETFKQGEVASPVEWGLDFAEMMLPFAEAKTVVGVAKTLGIPTSVKDYALYGSLETKIQNYMRSLSDERKQEAAYNVKDYLDNNSGYFGGNAAMAYFYADQFIENPTPNAAVEMIDNIFGMLDIAGVGKGMKGAVKRVASNLTHTPSAAPLKIIGIAHPEAAENVYIRGITKDEKLLETLGSTREEARSASYPKTSVSVDSEKFLQSLPAKMAEGVNYIQTRARLLAKEAAVPSRMLLNTVEVKAAAESKLVRIAKDLGKIVPNNDELYTKANIPMSPIEVTDKGFKIKTVMQPESGKGWINRTAMVNDVMTKLKGTDVDGIDFWFKPADSNIWEKIDQKLPKIAEQRKGEWAYSMSLTVDDDPMWKQALGADYVNAYMGRAQKYIFGPHGMFHKNIMHPATVSRDRSAAMGARMHQLVKGSIKRIDNKEDFKKVIDVLQKGDQESKTYSPSELQELFGLPMNSGSQQAYYEFRAIQDELWTMANDDTRHIMLRDGWVSVYDDAGNIVNKAVKPFKFDDAKVLVDKPLIVYNQTKKVFLKISGKAELQKIYDKGGVLVRLNESMRQGDSVFDYAVITPTKNTRLGKLTNTPLTYRSGHVSRIYKNNEIFVQLKNNKKATRNGRPDTHSTETVAVVANRAEAEHFMEKFKDNYPDGELAIYNRKDITQGMSKEELDYERMTNGFMSIQKRRGDRLLDVTGSEAAIENPLESMGRTIHAMSHRTAVKPFFDTQVNAWMKTFGKKVGAKGFPSDETALSDILHHSSVDMQTKAKARAHWQYINMVRGMPSTASQIWKTYMRGFAEILDTKPGGPSILKLMSKFGISEDAKFLNAFKKAAFNLFIALNPIKHLLLQPTQIWQMAVLHPIYFNTKFPVEFIDMMTALTSKGKYGTKAGKELAIEFEKSGLLEAVQHHVFLNPGSEAISSPLAPQFAGAGTKALRSMEKVVSIPRKGFELGEDLNMSMHWLVARHRWMEKNPGKNWKSPMASAEIQAGARDISLNFSPAGKMGYQDWGTNMGAMSSMLLQFFSHSHKTFMSMMPEALGGNKVFTKAEKLRLAMGNTLLFGATVWPFVDKYVGDVIANVDPQMDPQKAQLIKTGMVDYVTSKAISIMSGEEVDVRPQKSLAPMGNIEQTMTTFYQVLTESPQYRPYVSAPLAVFGVIGDVGQVLTTAWAMDDEVFTNKDIYMNTLLTLAETAPVLSSITQATMAVQTGKISSKFGNEVGEVNTVEALWKLTGMQTGVEADYYDARNKFFSLKSGSGGGKSTGSGREGEIRSEVNSYFNNFNRIMKTAPYTKAEKAAMFTRALLLMYNTPKEKAIAYREINSMARKMMERGEANFWSDVITYAYQSPAVEELQKFTQYLHAPKGLSNTIQSLEESRGGQ